MDEDTSNVIPVDFQNTYQTNQVAPAPVAPPVGAITSPDQVPQDTGTQPINLLSGASTSYAGPTAAGHRRAQGMLGDIDQRVAAYDARDAASTAQSIDAYRQNIAGEKQAIGAVQDVNSDYEKQLGAIDIKRQALFEESARQEKQAAVDAKISAANFTNAYQQQLAAVRSMSVNIAGPLASLSTGQAGGLSLAMFAQGFLGAQGININVAGQVDKWVDRSIQEQQRKIQSAEAGAQDTLNLWQIARQNSNDDLEARQRYRGYIIEGLKSQTEFQAARFQSRLASAQAGVTQAHLDTEATMTADQMTKAHEARVFEQKKWETTTAFELEKVNLEKQRVALEAAKANQKANKMQVIIDPSDGKAKWVVREDRINASDDAKQSVIAAAKYGVLDKLAKEAIEFRSKNGSDQWGHLSLVDRYTEPKRQYDAMVKRLAIAMGKEEFGTRASDKEAERIQTLVPFDKWYESGGNARVWDKYREDIRSDFQESINQHADAIPEENQGKVRTSEVNPSARAIYEAGKDGKAPVGNFAGYEQANVVGKDSDDVGDHSYGSHVWKKFVTNSGTSGKEAVFGVDKGGESKMPGWAVAIDHLANGWAKPNETKAFGDKHNTYFATENETPEQIRQESEATLRQLATGSTKDGKQVPEAAQKYAKFILKTGISDLADQLGKNPYEESYTNDDQKFMNDLNKEREAYIRGNMSPEEHKKFEDKMNDPEFVKQLQERQARNNSDN